MSAGFEVVQADIRASADQLQVVADGVGRADPSGDLGGVATALPGSASAAAATSLVAAWEERFSTWDRDATAQSTALHASADAYDAADHEAALRMRATPYAQQPH